MKNFALLFALFVFAGTAAAQSTDSDNATASVEVVSAISLTKTADINFGSVAAGTGAVNLSPTTGATDAGDGSSATAGAFTVAGSTGEDFTVSFPTTLALVGPGTDITFSPAVVGNASNAQGAATAVSTGDTRTLAGGDYYFWVGGGISVPSGQSTGAYSGTFTMQVEYTGL